MHFGDKGRFVGVWFRRRLGFDHHQQVVVVVTVLVIVPNRLQKALTNGLLFCIVGQTVVVGRGCRIFFWIAFRIIIIIIVLLHLRQGLFPDHVLVTFGLVTTWLWVGGTVTVVIFFIVRRKEAYMGIINASILGPQGV